MASYAGACVPEHTHNHTHTYIHTLTLTQIHTFRAGNIIEYLPSIYKALGLVSSRKTRKKKREGEKVTNSCHLSLLERNRGNLITSDF